MEHRIQLKCMGNQLILEGNQHHEELKHFLILRKSKKVLKAPTKGSPWYTYCKDLINNKFKIISTTLSMK